jgi:hypothetical protein
MPETPMRVDADQNAATLAACRLRTAGEEGEDVRTLVHDLGNYMVGIAFGLERLRGCQPTEQLETVVERMLRATEQGIALTRTLLQKAKDRSKAGSRLHV